MTPSTINGIGVMRDLSGRLTVIFYADSKAVMLAPISDGLAAELVEAVQHVLAHPADRLAPLVRLEDRTADHDAVPGDRPSIWTDTAGEPM